MNYLQMIAFHQMKKVGLTIPVISFRKEQAGRFGMLEAGNDYRVVGFEEKPVRPKTMTDAPEYAFVSMGIYAFKIGVLREALRMPGDDFGRDIIPAMIGNRFDVFLYDYETENKIEDFVVEVDEGKRNKVLTDKTRDSSYWRDVGSIESYFEASMDLVSVNPIFNLYGEKWPLRTFQRSLPPSKCVIGGKILRLVSTRATQLRTLMMAGVHRQKEQNGMIWAHMVAQITTTCQYNKAYTKIQILM
jgi:glucose-1-phosphate adenylyltransferase